MLTVFIKLNVDSLNYWIIFYIREEEAYQFEYVFIKTEE